MADNEQRHWWFAGRRAVLATLFRRQLSRYTGSIRILDAGCGSGGNLALLKSFGRVDAVEYDDGARQIAFIRSGMHIKTCNLPYDLPVSDSAYELIVLLDVLEHIDQDAEVLSALRTKLKINGQIIVTVPAFPWLWSDHDVIHHHKRRYTKNTLKVAAKNAGLIVEKMGYFNSLLFPVALARRLLSIIIRRHVEDDRMPAPPLNRLLRHIFSAERHTMGLFSMPIGLSIYSVLTKAK
ncbi:class I SAM-dependent methyltransferase [Methylobacterium sp. WL103]|uniref:class I SAM-dependent methyltransferase n=1 Tax=Methylobacterium sp. WL103 TaxID=2603891 RepID=UPI001650D2B2|nr:class I SAM-dependent methyltransferase [Methylobacterium sp. WL103]